MPRRLAAFLVLACVATWAWLALGAGGGDDPAATAAIVAKLEATPATKALTADAVRRSRAATERARRMRAAGDEPHAKLADGVARQWALVGQALAQAAVTEKKAEQARRAAADAGDQVDRERALLEQQLAQNGRMVAELAELEDGGAPAPPPKKAPPKKAPTKGGKK